MKKTNNPVKIPIRSPPPPKHPINTPKKSNPSFFGTIMEGFAFGTGSSIARETVGAIFNKPSFEKVNLKYSCEEIYKMFSNFFDPVKKTVIKTERTNAWYCKPIRGCICNWSQHKLSPVLNSKK